MDETQLVTALVAGATIAGVEVVKETTKDAYRGLKHVVGKVFGTRAQRAIEKVEASPDDASAKQALITLIQTVPAEDVAEIEPMMIALLRAMNADAEAKRAVQSAARIKLDVDAGGHIKLEYLQGATDIDVKAKSGGDFTLSGVKMGSEPDRGN